MSLPIGAVSYGMSGSKETIEFLELVLLIFILIYIKLRITLHGE